MLSISVLLDPGDLLSGLRQGGGCMVFPAPVAPRLREKVAVRIRLVGQTAGATVVGTVVSVHRHAATFRVELAPDVASAGAVRLLAATARGEVERFPARAPRYLVKVPVVVSWQGPALYMTMVSNLASWLRRALVGPAARGRPGTSPPARRGSEGDRGRGRCLLESCCRRQLDCGRAPLGQRRVRLGEVPSRCRSNRTGRVGSDRARPLRDQARGAGLDLRLEDVHRGAPSRGRHSHAGGARTAHAGRNPMRHRRHSCSSSPRASRPAQP